MMLSKGRYERERILSRPSVELVTTDHLTQEQKAENRLFFGDNSGWGFGMSVFTRRDDLAAVPDDSAGIPESFRRSKKFTSICRFSGPSFVL